VHGTARRRSLVVLSIASLWACDGGGPPAPPNVILISVDTLRADHLGCYGYERATSPFLDELAARGVRFERAFAQSSWTLPSHMSLVTSRYPRSHGVHNHDAVLPEGVSTVASALRAAGYSTTGFVSWVYLSAEFGFDRGFETFHELLPPEEEIDATTRHSIKAERFVDHVATWAEADADHGRPFFLFLHLFDPHANYDPPLEIARQFEPSLEDARLGEYDALKPFIRGMHRQPRRMPAADVRRVEALYDAEIRYTDRQLERLFDLLDAADRLDNTLIVFTSDHGEEFDDHGSMEGHQWTLYDEVLRVPLLVVLPDGAAAGTTIDRLVQTIDVAPTILDIAGVARPADFEGHSLAGLIAGESADWEEIAFAELRRFNLKWSLRTRDHKLVYTHDTGVNRAQVPVVAGYELYDLGADPAEQRDLHASKTELTERLGARLESYAGGGSTGAAAGAGPDLSDEQRERLRSLGYLGE